MALLYGAKFLNPTSQQSRPHVFGFAVPRTGTNPIFSVWNDDTGTDKKVVVYPSSLEVYVPVIPDVDITRDLGSNTKRFRKIWVQDVDASGSITGTTAGLATHIADQAVSIHGSASAATASKLVHRDASGRTKMAAPAASDDVAIKATVDSITSRTESGSNYGLVTGDVGLMIERSHGSACTLTIPLNSTQAIPVNSVIAFQQVGAGKVTVTATGGVTLNAQGSKVRTTGQNAIGFLIKKATDTWVVGGNLEVAS